MGNCMQSWVGAETGDQVIKVMRMDGKMLEYSPPLVVRDLLNEIGNYMLVHSDDVTRALPHHCKLEGGQLYYLVEALASENDSVDDGGNVQVDDVASSEGTINSFRVKIVVSKQQLKALLSDGLMEEKLLEQFLLKQLQSKAQQEEDSDVANRRWIPSLEKIPEIN